MHNILKIIYFSDDHLQITGDSGLVEIALTGDIIDYDCKQVLYALQLALTDTTKALTFKTEYLRKWDSSLLLILYHSLELADIYRIKYSLSGLPKNIKQLLQLAFTIDRLPPDISQKKLSFVDFIGYQTITICIHIQNFWRYLISVFAAFWRLISAQSIMRKIDFYAALNECGPKALGIVSLISFLIGLILAFVGAVQLQTFGAQIYVASLVTIGMCRIMGAIMVGIIMAGRTGSAYAATIGSMQVNEELDALQTMGLSLMDFLVLPRLLSLLVALPILTILADIMGIIGGAFIGVFFMNLPYQEYWKYTFNAFHLNNFLIGLFHSFCFGFIIALCGCYCGLTCGRNADGVGIAATRSVVNAIVWMIVVTGIITIICQEIKI